MLEANPRMVADSAGRMKGAPYTLDEARRKVVLESILQVCGHRGWLLIAAHIRTNHVHLVLDAEKAPEAVLNCLKAYASRALGEAGMEPPEVRRWSRHGSTRYLWNPGQIDAAVGYVASGQGEPLELYIAPDPRSLTVAAPGARAPASPLSRDRQGAGAASVSRRL
jgi:REP element-mobilizing transposase RayT